MFAEDMGVFFDPVNGMADWIVLQRPPAADVRFGGIVGAVSKEALQGNAMGVTRELRFAAGAVDLRDRDAIVHEHAGGSTAYTVRGAPQLQNDGSESVASLSVVRP